MSDLPQNQEQRIPDYSQYSFFNSSGIPPLPTSFFEKVNLLTEDQLKSEITLYTNIFDKIVNIKVEDSRFHDLIQPFMRKAILLISNMLNYFTYRYEIVGLERINPPLTPPEGEQPVG